MITFNWNNWLERLVRFMPRSARRPRLATRPVRRSHLDFEELEDRTLPAVSLLNAAAVIMKPTYQLLQRRARRTCKCPQTRPAGFGPAPDTNRLRVQQHHAAGQCSGRPEQDETIAIVDTCDDLHGDSRLDRLRRTVRARRSQLHPGRHQRRGPGFDDEFPEP